MTTAEVLIRPTARAAPLYHFTERDPFVGTETSTTIAPPAAQPRGENDVFDGFSDMLERFGGFSCDEPQLYALKKKNADYKRDYPQEAGSSSRIACNITLNGPRGGSPPAYPALSTGAAGQDEDDEDSGDCEEEDGEEEDEDEVEIIIHTNDGDQRSHLPQISGSTLISNTDITAQALRISPAQYGSTYPGGKGKPKAVNYYDQPVSHPFQPSAVENEEDSGDQSEVATEPKHPVEKDREQNFPKPPERWIDEDYDGENDMDEDTTPDAQKPVSILERPVDPGQGGQSLPFASKMHEGLPNAAQPSQPSAVFQDSAKPPASQMLDSKTVLESPPVFGSLAAFSGGRVPQEEDEALADAFLAEIHAILDQQSCSETIMNSAACMPQTSGSIVESAPQPLGLGMQALESAPRSLGPASLQLIGPEPQPFAAAVGKLGPLPQSQVPQPSDEICYDTLAVSSQHEDMSPIANQFRPVVHIYNPAGPSTDPFLNPPEELDGNFLPTPLQPSLKLDAPVPNHPFVIPLEGARTGPFTILSQDHDPWNPPGLWNQSLAASDPIVEKQEHMALQPPQELFQQPQQLSEQQQFEQYRSHHRPTFLEPAPISHSSLTIFALLDAEVKWSHSRPVSLGKRPYSIVPAAVSEYEWRREALRQSQVSLVSEEPAPKKRCLATFIPKASTRPVGRRARKSKTDIKIARHEQRELSPAPSFSSRSTVYSSSTTASSRGDCKVAHADETVNPCVHVSPPYSALRRLAPPPTSASRLRNLRRPERQQQSNDLLTFALKSVSSWWSR
ncbi:unnamed protein product [Mycena citricolor]|uniref:Uncharacterized protein n=1 Tax=Mycena citricolor TaxID=2018698 RepID=A0AAD2HHQ8_9AGAR|nr:unnamed protein product [Mycena citricolor]